MDTAARKELAAQIAPARKARKWTQKELSDATGGLVSVGAISNMERGETVPQLNNLLAVADALGIDKGAEVAAETRRTFSDDTQVIGDAVMVFLESLPIERRHKAMHDLTEFLFAYKVGG